MNNDNRVIHPVQRGNTHHLLGTYLRGRNGKRRGYIAGSYVVWAVQRNEPSWTPNDIDVFVQSEADQEHIMREMGAICYVQAERSDIAVRLRDYYGNHPDLNVIVGHPDWTKWPEDLFTSFDLSCSRAILLEDGKTALCDVDVAGSEGKVLRVNNPIRSMQRVMKYTARGWTFSDRELLKLFLAWDEVPDKRQNEMISSARWAIANQPSEDGYTNWHDDDYFEGE